MGNTWRYPRGILLAIVFVVVAGIVLIWPLKMKSIKHISTSGLFSTNVTDTRREEIPQSIDIATNVPKEQCKKRLPVAIVVGIQKAGTTTLLRFLTDHPQIATAKGGTGEPQYFSRYYDKPLEWYRQLMPCSYSNQSTIEKSPPYFIKAEVPERIRKMNPNTKIIIIVKEPIERALSMYTMLVDLNDAYVRGKSFEYAIMSNNKVNQKSPLIKYSTYPSHMQRWLDVFKRNQILIIDGHHFITDPSVELKKVEKFLQIGNYFTPDRFMFNKTKQMYCIIKAGVPTCMDSKKGLPHPVINTDVRQTLQEYFKPLNEKFFKIIGKRYEWGY